MISGGGAIVNTSRMPAMINLAGTTRKITETSTTMAGSTYAAMSDRPLATRINATMKPSRTPADNRVSPSHSAASARTRSDGGSPGRSSRLARRSTSPTISPAVVEITA